MAEFQEVMRQLNRLCSHYQYCSDCPMFDECANIGAYCSEPKHSDRIEKTVMAWAAEHPEPVYPTWGEWFVSRGMLPEKWDNLTSAYMNVGCVPNLIHSPIPADIAEKLGIEPKGES